MGHRKKSKKGKGESSSESEKKVAFDEAKSKDDLTRRKIESVIKTKEEIERIKDMLIAVRKDHSQVRNHGGVVDQDLSVWANKQLKDNILLWEQELQLVKLAINYDKKSIDLKKDRNLKLKQELREEFDGLSKSLGDQREFLTVYFKDWNDRIASFENGKLANDQHEKTIAAQLKHTEKTILSIKKFKNLYGKLLVFRQETGEIKEEEEEAVQGGGDSLSVLRVLAKKLTDTYGVVYDLKEKLTIAENQERTSSSSKEEQVLGDCMETNVEVAT